MPGPALACSGRKTDKRGPDRAVMPSRGHISVARASLLGVVAWGVLTASFANNTFGVVRNGMYSGFQRDSESLVVGRILQSRAEGFLSEGGLTGRRDVASGAGYRRQYTLYRRDEVGAGFTPYRSHPGLNGAAAAVMDSLLPKREGGNLTVLRAGMAAASAGGFAAAVAMVWRRFGWGAGLAFVLGTLFSGWVTLFAPNLWWSLWAMYAPIVAAAWCVARRPSWRTIAVVSALAMSIKVAMTGYEYVTAVVVSGLVPFAYAWASRQNVARLSREAAVYISGLLATGAAWLAVLVAQNGYQSGAWGLGPRHVLTVLGNRTHGDPATHDPLYQEALSATLWESTRPYLLDFGPFSFGDGAVLSYGTWCLVTAVACGVALWLARVQDEYGFSLRGLVFATLCSVLAPLSWFILFKGHNYIHVHMNAIVWHLPFVPVSLVLVGRVIHVGWNRWRS